MGATYQTPISTTAVDSAREQAEQLIGRARELGPVIREHLEEAEHERRLAKPVRDALRAAGFQRMLAPKSLGGLEVDPVTCAQVVEEIGPEHAGGGCVSPATADHRGRRRLPRDGPFAPREQHPRL